LESNGYAPTLHALFPPTLPSQPDHTEPQIRTAITQLAFNPSSEMLAFSSKYVKQSMRVAHMARRRVFANWPTSKTPLNYVQCAAFSPHSGYLAFGNDKGHAMLYRVNHYAGA